MARVTIQSDPGADTLVARLRAAGCVFAEDEAELLRGAARTPQELASMVERRVCGQPLEYILGWVEFCGLRVAVDPGVFVPRQRTALLVREAAARTAPGATVSDLACGCGAIGLAVAAAVGPLRLYAVDVEPAAVACAQRNLAPLTADVYRGDLFDPLPDGLRGCIDTVVANVPYVPTDAVDLMPPEARDYEPRVALDGGVDGLDVLRRVASGAARWLVPGGHVLMEVGEDQVPDAVDALATAGLVSTVERDEELGATVVIGQRPASSRPAGWRAAG
jgi:release factor glutamine methyltransferase